MPLELSPVDVERLLSAAAERVRAAVLREAKPSTELRLGPLARLKVWGAFVSLKLEPELRACCGACGELAPLAASLGSAADRAATSDPRFEPIHPLELNQLTLEVWLLDSPERLPNIGALRANEVEVGRHGLQVVRKGQRGAAVAERGPAVRLVGRGVSAADVRQGGPCAQRLAGGRRGGVGI